MIVVAPTEPPVLKAIASAVNLMPEKFGADVFFIANGRKVGIQRKEYHDLFQSVNDGRLAKEVMQLQHLDYKILIVEGVMQWTTEGQLMDRTFGQEWSKSQFIGLLLSVMDRGIWVLSTSSTLETASLCLLLKSWLSKTSHLSLSTRPGVGKGMWGDGPDDREFGAWMMQGIPGVGPKVAEAIVGKFGGMPLELTVGAEELMEVDGVGKGRADMIVKSFTPKIPAEIINLIQEKLSELDFTNPTEGP